MSLGARGNAAILDFAGAYTANLAILETPVINEPPVEVFYGRLDLTVSKTGGVSGVMNTRKGLKYAFTTTVTQAVGASTATQPSVVVFRDKQKNPLITMALTINADGSLIVDGINDNPLDIVGTFFASDSYRFATFTGKVGSTPSWIGKYTLALVSPNPAGATVPAGAGYASLSVAATGVLTYTGKLGDGTAITGSVKPTATGDYTLYFLPKGYLVGGYFSAQLNLTTTGAQTEKALWNKPAKLTDKAYPAGFYTTLDALVQPWLVPAKGAYPFGMAVGFGSSQNFEVSFSNEGLSDGDYSATLPDTLRVTALSIVQAVSGAVGAPVENNSKEWNKLWSVKLNPLTGVFTGTQILRHLNGAKLVTRKIPIEGVISLASTLTADPFAYGQYRVTPKALGSKEVSGLIEFLGPLVENTDVATSGTYSAKMNETAVTDSTVKIGSNTAIDNPNPVRPVGSPKDNQVVKFTISEDLQTLTFNGQVLKYQGIAFGGYTYNKTVFSGRTIGTFSVTIVKDLATGKVTDLAGFASFITAGRTSRTQDTVFELLEPASVNLVKQ